MQEATMPDPLHPQLAPLAAELQTATDRARALAKRLDEEAFARRPAAERWSPAECVAHLNLTTRAFLPLIDEALARGRASGRRPTGRYRRDLVGFLLAQSLEPPHRFRMATTAPFVPSNVTSRDAVVGEFVVLQEELIHRVEQASGLDLNRLRLASAFNPRLKYNLFSCFSVLAAHERRHLWQAEEAADAAGTTDGAD
jgi:hypothetical protein